MKKHTRFLCALFVAFFSIASFTSCIREPEIIIETVVETDTIFVVQQDTVFLTLSDTISLTEFIHDTATTFILLRHAETTGIGSDPDLSAVGMARVEALRKALSLVPLEAVYSTDYKRTKQTAQPVADDKFLNVNAYTGTNLSPFVDGLLAAYHGKTVMVVGHSNTTPSLLNVLVGANVYSTFPDTEYDNLFVVTVFEKGRAMVVRLKYGA